MTNTKAKHVFYKNPRKRIVISKNDWWDTPVGHVGVRVELEKGGIKEGRMFHFKNPFKKCYLV